MTVVFLTSTGANTWPKPADWNDSTNQVECIGCGAWGGPRQYKHYDDS